MTNTMIENLVTHFGQDLAMRIAACAMIMTAENEKCGGDIEIGLRMTIGALKRIRRQGGYGIKSYTEAVERLELEQDEGRHYTGAGATKLQRDIKRIEQANGASYTSIVDGVETVHDPIAEAKQAKKDTQAKAIAAIYTMLTVEAGKLAESVEHQQGARDWIKAHWDTMSATKRKFLTVVLEDYRNGLDIAEDKRKNISKRYAPKGVKPMEYVELLARYA